MAVLTLALAVGLSFYSAGQPATPLVKSIALSTEPVFVTSEGDKPTLTLALSVEFPTAGAQYLWNRSTTTTGNSALDDSYRSASEYLGYYDAESCYVYNNAPTEVIPSGFTTSDYKRFDHAGPAVRRQCSDAFSGNFLNWASSSSPDMLRLALSGGDRYIDTETLTILQRTIVPAGDPVCMWNNGMFPAKRLSRLDGGVNRFYGAIPRAMSVAAGLHDIWIANMLDRVYFRADDTPTGHCADTSGYRLSLTAGLSMEEFFYSRVSVCNMSAAGGLLDKRDYKFCELYPSGHYKPNGVIQRYSDQMRLAAFGYLLDSTPSWGGGRFGGVLRAPMKYVGHDTFDIFGALNTPAGGNPHAEWDKRTGVFHPNPDNDTTQTPGISGVINYLNKFGRTGVKGRYKVYDPVGELHYEALRYLQGLQPTPAAVSSITTDMFDGFPVTTSWIDPYGDGRSSTANYACTRSNLMVIGDTGTNDGSNLPRPSVVDNIPDISAWITTVRAFEMNNASTYADGQQVPRLTGNPNVSNPSPRANQIIGTSYWAHSHDIRGKTWTAKPALQRPGLRVKTFIFDVNYAGEEDDINRRRFNNQFFTAAKYGGYESDAAAAGASSFNTFGNPFQREDGTNDNAVWQKVDDPGEAKTYYRQSSGRGVLAAFDEIFEKTGSRAQSIAGTARQSRRTTAFGNVFYQSAFQTADWSGDVLAVPVSLNSTADALSIGATPYWSASSQLLALPNPAATRKIYVGRPGGNAVPVAVAFDWVAINGSTLAKDLDKAKPASPPDGLGRDRLLYLRGDRSKEGIPFRVRTKLLGDVINSAVAYSGPPSSVTQSSTYVAFVDLYKKRLPAAFVGANDGMLHAFDATVSQTNSGNELFAYIPSWMSPKLAALTAPEYLASHQSYVDGSPTIADAQISQGGTANDWRTVLVSGTGAGGKGVFALDVTNPATFSASNVMWEFTASDDLDIGNVVGKAQILKIRRNALSAAVPVFGWYAAIASGVNNYLPDSNGLFSRTGQPALFLLDIAKPQGSAWVLNSNYFKISLPADAVLSKTKAPGVLNFTAALNSVDAVDKIYAGDLHGNIWKLDFSRASQGSRDWTLAKLSGFNRGTSDNSAFPLYTARDASGDVQSITAGPTLVRGSTGGITYVTVGTGKYLEKSDDSNKQTNSIYSIFDTDALVSADAATGSQIAGRGRLQAGTAVASTGKVTVPAFTWGHATSDGDMSKRSGWYFDLPTVGERQVSGGSLFGDSLIFGSLVVGVSAAAQTCGGSSSSASGASTGGSAVTDGGFEYQVNIDTGNGVSSASKVGILGEPFILDLPSLATGSGAFDNTGQKTKTLRAQLFQQGSLGIAASSPLTLNVTVGRLSWRQINNYQELKNAAKP